MKSNSKLLLMCITFGMLLMSCANEAAKVPAPDPEKLKATIQAMEDAFAAAEKAKDAAAVAAYYSDDAVSYGRNEAPLSGKAAIHASIAKRIATDTTGNYSVYKVVDLLPEGNMLVEIGSWDSFNKAGNPIDKGHYLSVFKLQENGKYVCVRDMNATSSPAK